QQRAENGCPPAPPPGTILGTQGDSARGGAAMAVRQTILEQVSRFLDEQRLAELPDAELVGRFVAAHDDAAFAALVRRHGPVVLGLCRRLLRQTQDAEDAFQASFLVLARKAASLRKRQSLGAWMYGVAYRIASKARVAAARRGAHERQAALIRGELAVTEPEH